MTEGELLDDVRAELRRLGVSSHRNAAGPLDRPVTSWLQLLPAVRDPQPPEIDSGTHVLFELYRSEQLSELVGEVLRLGNDRMGFRFLGNGQDRRTLLRIIGPPYYCLLRAVDRDHESAPKAYIRLRQHSRILEPHEKIDPYRQWRRHGDDLSRQLTGLFEVHDGEQLKHRIGELLSTAAGKKGAAADEARVLSTALELTPRLDEAFAVELLDRVLPLLEREIAATDQQRVLEKGLFVAGHFNQTDYVVLDSESRRWLDEDEFLVRRRIHRDVKTVMSQAGF